VEFASVVDAVRCAVEVQQVMPGRDTGVEVVRVGRIDEARQAMSRALRLEPGCTLARMSMLPWRDRPFGTEMRAALVLAGAPE
jgi:hypothetical protein